MIKTIAKYTIKSHVQAVQCIVKILGKSWDKIVDITATVFN